MSAVRVAVADDSPFIRKVLARMLGEEPDLELVGTAGRGEELLAALPEWRPDLIILDLVMPGIGGLATLDEIMLRRPTPVIILSENLHGGASRAVEALHRGALDVIDKRSLSLVDFEGLRRSLIDRIRGVAGGSPLLAVEEPGAVPGAEPPAGQPPDLLLVGASTGGPSAVGRVLRDLGAELPVPLIVAQHMPAGFTRAFAARLDAHLPIAVREPTDGEELLPGTAYVAPGGFHTTVVQRQNRLFAHLHDTDDRVQPSVDRLFTSAAAAVGDKAVAVLLTGMGEDGARGMTELARVGAYTIAQDEKTSVVFGMPRAAILAGAIREVRPLADIGGRLRELASRASRSTVEEGISCSLEKCS